MELGLEADDSRPPFTILAVKGEVDIQTAAQLLSQLDELENLGKHRLVVDLEGVEFLDSSGLRVLVDRHKRLRSVDGDLALVCTRPRILRVFEITALTRLFSIYSSVDEAISAAASR